MDSDCWRAALGNMSDKRKADTAGTKKILQKVRRKKSDSDKGRVVVEDSESHLCGIEIHSILFHSTWDKTIYVHGKLADQEAVVIMEKTPFHENTLAELFRGLKLEMRNDIYSTHQLQLPPEINEIKTTVVCPATGKYINTFLCQERFQVEETNEDYRSITLPYIEKKKRLNIQWVYNILEKKAETDSIVYEDLDPGVGFVLIPDIKWDRKQVDELHLIAIVNQRNIKSLRDLTSEHLPLLQNIFLKGKVAIQQCYNLPACDLRVYLHYQPSFYHLHVHFTNMNYWAEGCQVEQAHLLTDVIQKLLSDPHYYKNRRLYFPLREKNQLLIKFKESKASCIELGQ